MSKGKRNGDSESEEPCEDEDDFREMHGLIAAELEDEFRGKF
jgi:hypothetical protein